MDFARICELADRAGSQPYAQAVSENDEIFLHLLFANDPNAELQAMPLVLRLASEYGNLGFIRILKEYYQYDISQGLFIAAKNNQVHIVQWYFSQNGQPFVLFNQKLRSPLFIACSRGHIAIVDFFMNHPNLYKLVDKPDYLKQTPFLRACKKNQLECARMIMRRIHSSEFHLATEQCGDHVSSLLIGAPLLKRDLFDIQLQALIAKQYVLFITASKLLEGIPRSSENLTRLVIACGSDELAQQKFIRSLSGPEIRDQAGQAILRCGQSGIILVQFALSRTKERKIPREFVFSRDLAVLRLVLEEHGHEILRDIPNLAVSCSYQSLQVMLAFLPAPNCDPPSYLFANINEFTTECAKLLIGYNRTIFFGFFIARASTDRDFLIWLLAARPIPIEIENFMMLEVMHDEFAMNVRVCPSNLAKFSIHEQLEAGFRYGIHLNEKHPILTTHRKNFTAYSKLQLETGQPYKVMINFNDSLVQDLKPYLDQIPRGLSSNIMQRYIDTYTIRDFALYYHTSQTTEHLPRVREILQVILTKTSNL